MKFSPSANEEPIKTTTELQLKKTESCMLCARHFFEASIQHNIKCVKLDVNILIDSAESPNENQILGFKSSQ